MEQAHLNPETPRQQNATLFRALAVVLGTSIIASSVWACSGVGPRGKPVVFGDQTNIVIWDEAHHTEHFIRNANFRSGADDFGFIAPTPGKPQLNGASNQVFYTLASLQPIPVYNAARAGSGGFGGGKSRSSEVKVIQEADVAGYHATTLWATNAQAINDWMNEHGYVSTPEVEEWADRYTSRGWYLTAFKVVDKSKLAASTGTVRMSFKTNKPYNPFYVPTSNIQPTKKGTLRVYFVAAGDYDANIGTVEPWKTPIWTAPVPDASAALLAKQIEVNVHSIPKNAQVETFVDPDFPRPAADDIYFVKRRINETPKAPDAIPTRTVPPLVLTPIFAALGLVAVAKRRRA
jgi:hypothetical protein